MEFTMTDLYRGIVCKIEIVKGSKVLKTAQYHARHLWNFTRYCAVGYNYRLRKQRGDWYGLGKMPKYPGSSGMWKAMHDTEEYKSINDRVASYVLRQFDGNMRSWFSNLKSNPKARPPSYAKISPPLTFEVGRNAKLLGMNIWRLSALSGSVDERYVFARIYLPPMTNPDRVASINLRDGRCAVSYMRRQKERFGSQTAGIDLGINRIATVAFENGESIMYAGGLLLSKQRYYQKKLANCKPPGWQKGRDLRGLSDNGKRYYQDWLRQKRLILDNLTTSIINECVARDVGTIVLGNIKGIREGKDYGKEMNQKLHAWPYWQIDQMLRNKAELFGIKITTVSEKYTSRTCMLCEHVNTNGARKQRGMLTCKNCGQKIHADVNGAFNILKKYLPADKQLGVVVRLRSLPSTGIPGNRRTSSQIDPTFSAIFDLRNYAVVLNRC